VYESEFEIVVTLRAASTAPRGPVVVPAELKYQACNDSVCFAPSNASTSWRLEVV